MKFEDLMLHIEKRPQVYVGEKNIFLLSAFLSGYLFNESLRLGERASYDFRYDFYNWLQKKFNLENNSTWADFIEIISKNENLNSVDVFFREYHLFKKVDK